MASSQDRSAKDHKEKDCLLKGLKSAVTEYSKLLALLKARITVSAKQDRLAS
jgi:hypothetical protein